MGAITAATLAAVKGAAVIGSAAASLGSAGASFKQAADNKRRAREADEAAANFLKKAQEQYKTNFAEQLQVPLEGYRTAAEMNTAATTQILDAMKESGQRAILGGVAGLQQQAQDGSEQLRMAMQQDLYQRDQLVTQEDAQIRDRLAALDLDQATGAQQRAADSEIRRAQSIENAFTGLKGGMSALYEGADLFGGNQNNQITRGLYGKSITPEQKSQADRVLNNMSQEEIDDLIKNKNRSGSIFSMPGFTPGMGMGRPSLPGVKMPAPFNPFKK